MILEYKTLILERSLNPSRLRINETFRCSFEKRICHAKKKVGGEGRTGGRARNISRIYALDVVNERAVQLCDLRTWKMNTLTRRNEPSCTRFVDERKLGVKWKKKKKNCYLYSINFLKSKANILLRSKINKSRAVIHFRYHFLSPSIYHGKAWVKEFPFHFYETLSRIYKSRDTQQVRDTRDPPVTVWESIHDAGPPCSRKFETSS